MFFEVSVKGGARIEMTFIYECFYGVIFKKAAVH
jgi:hypothetical protein